jgi:hypothetical protein
MLHCQLFETASCCCALWAVTMRKGSGLGGMIYMRQLKHFAEESPQDESWTSVHTHGEAWKRCSEAAPSWRYRGGGISMSPPFDMGKPLPIPAHPSPRPTFVDGRTPPNRLPGAPESDRIRDVRGPHESRGRFLLASQCSAPTRHSISPRLPWALSRPAPGSLPLRHRLSCGRCQIS